jgi:hypothetical protein
MHPRSFAAALCSLAVLALMIAAIPENAAGTKAGDEAAASSSSSAPPIVVAQGRCFNGRCY